MPRDRFQLQVKRDRVAEYRDRHAAVWPEMLRALAETGWHNYSLFLRPDGLLIGYVESDDLAAAQAAMDTTDVNARWQAEMGEFFEALDLPPDQAFVLLEEVFHLEDQLAHLDDPLDENQGKPTMTTFADITGRLEKPRHRGPVLGHGNSGTRFKVFGSPGTPRTVEEKIADAAAVHRFTGLAPSVALHIPWDLVDDYAALRTYAEDHGVALGTVNSNTFQDDDFKLGSLTNADPAIRKKAVQHNLDCIEVMNATVYAT